MSRNYLKGQQDPLSYLGPLTPFKVTPDDDAKQPHLLRAVTVGSAGDLAIETVEGDQLVIPGGALEIGIQHSILTWWVLATGTTATEIIGWY